MTMTAQPAAAGSSRQAAPHGSVPALAGGTGPVAVRVFPGLPEQVREARSWVGALASAAGMTDPGDPVLVLSELFSNAVLHTRSGREGGKVTVAVTADGVIHVHDYSPGQPCPGLSGHPAGGAREDFGHGLKVIAALCTGPAHMPAAWCPAGGPDDPACEAGGCCTCCRPAAWPQAAVSQVKSLRLDDATGEVPRLEVTAPLSLPDTAARLSVVAADLAAALEDEEAAPLAPLVLLDRVCDLAEALSWAMCREPATFPLGGLAEIARHLIAESSADGLPALLAVETSDGPGHGFADQTAGVILAAAVLAEQAGIDLDTAVARKVAALGTWQAGR